MAFVYVAAMILALIGMIVCSKKQKTNPMIRPVAFVLFVIVVIAAFLLLDELGVFSGGINKSVIANEERFYSSQGAKVGAFLKTTVPNKKVLLIADRGYENNPVAKKLADALQESYGGEVVLDTVTVDFSGDPLDTPPLFELMKAKDFDALVEKHSDAGVIVTMIGLPKDANNLKFLKQPADKRPTLFLIGRSESNEIVLPSLQSGAIAGIIIPNPQAKYDVPAPSDPLEAFDIRYVLVTKENAEQYKDNF